MRIISGSHRGRKIQGAPTPDCRPSKGAVRESLFHILAGGRYCNDAGGPILQGARFLDICAGTGAISLEALSCGADFAVLIDHTPAHLAVAYQNIQAFGETHRTRLLQADATRLPRAEEAFSLVYIDPPYHAALLPRILTTLAKQGWLAPAALVVIEQPSQATPPVVAGVRVEEVRQYGKTQLLFSRYCR